MGQGRKYDIKPAGPLMKEHRLIEQASELLEKQLKLINDQGKVEVAALAKLIDFFKVYVDWGHHKKEEDFLFFPLKEKELNKEHSQLLETLLKEHQVSRDLILELDVIIGKDKINDQDKETLSKTMKKLISLYAGHIFKEDKQFFLPSMQYFSDKEKDQIIDEFYEFDKKQIDNGYRKMLTEIKEAGE